MISFRSRSEVLIPHTSLDISKSRSLYLNILENYFIQNTGSCPLIFRLCLVDQLEGEIPRVQEESWQRPDKKKRKGKAESNGKSRGKPEFDDHLRSNEELAIFGGNLERSMDRSLFSFQNLDESKQLLVPQGRKMEFGVEFRAINERKDVFGKNDSNKIMEKTSKEKKKSKTKKKVEDLKKSNYCHVAMVKLILGSSTSLWWSGQGREQGSAYAKVSAYRGQRESRAVHIEVSVCQGQHRRGLIRVKVSIYGSQRRSRSEPMTLSTYVGMNFYEGRCVSRSVRVKVIFNGGSSATPQLFLSRYGAEEGREEKNARMCVRRIDLGRTCIPDTGRPGLAEARVPFHRRPVTPSWTANPPATAGCRQEALPEVL
ncbi:hypothetical protein WN48_05852 [Eufriesea mexicana]|uniref:Uncharacterized protein n=1 Tax=Eufriesea mexicana TaxID=516756 RepID=A0A310SI24_9HYME|nr:hypothetical protein WN48_05852 [Eufriesea mexicana]